MRRRKLICLSLLTMFALSAAIASSASAHFPLWHIRGAHCTKVATGGEYSSLADCAALNTLGGGPYSPGWNNTFINLYRLGEGQSLPVTSKGGEATLSAANVKIKCTSSHDTGTITGGDPGTDAATVTFLNCEVYSPTGTLLANCKVKSKGQENWGTIVTDVDSELVYLSKEGAENGTPPVGDLFTPAEAGNFVTLVFEGSECPNGATGEVKVSGSVAAEISPPAATGEPGEEGEVAPEGTLKFPGTAIKKIFKLVSGTVKGFEPKLLLGALTATEIGEESEAIEPSQISENLWIVYEIGVLSR
jgi:hypothetical protein